MAKKFIKIQKLFVILLIQTVLVADIAQVQYWSVLSLDSIECKSCLSPQLSLQADEIKSIFSELSGNTTSVKGSGKEITRRRFLQWLGIVGTSTLMPLLFPRNVLSGIAIKTKPGLGEELEDSGLILGEYFETELRKYNIGADKNNPILKLLVNYFNTSDWWAAAMLVNEQPDYFKSIKTDLEMTKELKLFLELIEKLENLYVKAKARQGISNLFRVFSGGRFPLYGKRTGGGGVECDSEDLINFSYFKTLDLWNNINKTFGYTATGIPVYSACQHQWSYRAWKQLQKMGVISASDHSPLDKKKQKVIKVSYDAHKDLGVKTDEGEYITQAMMGVLMSNKSEADVAKVVQQLGVANFNIPAFLEGLMDEMVWVVPKEAAKQGYTPEYGSYDLYIGRLKDNPDKIESFSPRLDGKPGQSAFSEAEFDSIKYWDGKDSKYLDVRKVKIHVVSPTDKITGISSETKLQQLMERLVKDDVVLLLDVDLDFFGAVDPLSRAGLPNFATNDARFNELMDSLRLFSTNKAIMDKIKAITVASSPSFTDKLEARDITATVLGMFVDRKSSPQWIKNEIDKDMYKKQIIAKENSVTTRSVSSQKDKTIAVDSFFAGIISRYKSRYLQPRITTDNFVNQSI